MFVIPQEILIKKNHFRHPIPDIILQYTFLINLKNELKIIVELGFRNIHFDWIYFI
jgi:hypothetical protein